MQLTSPMPGCVKPRDTWLYTSGPHDITLGVEQVFDFPARGPLGLVQVRLLCTTANNGYEIGREIPIELVYRQAAGDRDGMPRWSWTVEGTCVRLFIAATTIEVTDSVGAFGTFTDTDWKIKLYATA